MTTEDLKTLFVKAYDYTLTKYGKKADSIQIEEDGSIRATWSTYIGCGDWENDYETFRVEDLTLNN
jgi:hypothetical protein